MTNEYDRDLYGKGELILLIENNPAQRRLYHEVLSVNGYQVHSAENSIQAIALYQQFGHETALVLSNTDFPSLHEILSYIISENYPIPVLLTSSSFSQSKYLNAENIQVVKKSADIVELFGSIKDQILRKETPQMVA